MLDSEGSTRKKGDSRNDENAKHLFRKTWQKFSYSD